jgi:hypothetical protein
MKAPRLTTRGRKTAEAIAARRAFRTNGALKARAGAPGFILPHEYGRLYGDDRDAFDRDAPRIVYIVYSYATPIAWCTSEKVYIVRGKFSRTTSKHQGVLYMLASEVRP